MKIQYFHNRRYDYVGYDIDGLGRGIKKFLRSTGGSTIALQVPTIEQFNEFKMTPEDHWGTYPSVELEVGMARCSTEDNYNKKLGRLKSKHRMKPQGFWVRKHTENELILCCFDLSLKIPELILRKSPKGDRVYFVGVV